MSDQPEQQPKMPPIEEVRYLNANIMIGDPDENGNREMTFPVGPLKLITFVIAPEGAAFILKRFSGGIERVAPNDLPDLAAVG